MSTVYLSHGWQYYYQESVLNITDFDTDFTSEEAQDSNFTDSVLSKTIQNQFRGFTYNSVNEHLSKSVIYSSVIR